MGLEGVSRQYRLITGQDSPTDAKQTKAASEPAAPGPELEPEVVAEPEPVAEIVDEDGAPLEETPAEPEPEPES